MDIKPFIDVDKFTVDIDADQDDIQHAMRVQTSLTAYYGIQHSHAQKQLSRMKLIEKTTRAALSKKVRREIVDAGERATAGEIAERVDLLTDMQKTALLLIDAQEVETICKVAYEAFRTRREMLVSLGNLHRANLQTGGIIGSAKEAVSNYHQRREQRDEGYRARRKRLAEEAATASETEGATQH